MIVLWLVPIFVIPAFALLVLHRPRSEFIEVARRDRAIDALKGIYANSERERLHHHDDRPAGGPEHSDQGPWAGRFRIVGRRTERSERAAETEEAFTGEHGVA